MDIVKYRIKTAQKTDFVSWPSYTSGENWSTGIDSYPKKQLLVI
jgi:hypothetical protein